MSSFKLAPIMLFVTKTLKSPFCHTFWKSELNTQNEKVLRGEVRAIENTERIYVSIQNIVRLSHFLSVRYFTINSSLSRIYAKCQVSPSWDLNKNSLGWWKKIIYPSFIWNISNFILHLITSKPILLYYDFVKIYKEFSI